MVIEYNFRSIGSTITLLIFLKQKIGKSITIDEIKKNVEVGKQVDEIEKSLGDMINTRLVFQIEGYFYLHPEYFELLDKAFDNLRLTIK